MSIVFRNRTRVISSALAVAIVCLGPAFGQKLHGDSPQAGAGQSESRHLQGVWFWQLQGRDCTAGTPIGNPAPGLLTFAAGGTLSETSTVPMPPVPLTALFLRSPGHGTWERQNWEYYTAGFVLQRLNPDGTFAGWTRLRGRIQLREGGTEFAWTGTGELIAPNGTVLLNTCNSASAVRFE